MRGRRRKRREGSNAGNRERAERGGEAGIRAGNGSMAGAARGLTWAGLKTGARRTSVGGLLRGGSAGGG